MDDNYRLKAGLCIFDMNDGGRIISVDDDLFRFTGYSQDYVRENELTVFSLFDRAYREDTETILNDAAKEGRVFCIRQPMNCRDGSSLFVHCCGYVRDCSRVEMVISDCRCHDSLDGAQKKLMRQITEQQEKLHMIAENTDDVYYQ